VESTDNTGLFPNSAPNTNIAIARNLIADSGRSGIWVGQLNGGTTVDNVIIGWDLHPEVPLFGAISKRAHNCSRILLSLW
jgi:hypothetical protein